MKERSKRNNMVSLPEQNADRWLIDCLDTVLKSGISLHSKWSIDAEVLSVLEMCREAICRLEKFEIVGFDWFDDDALGTSLAYSVPEEGEDLLRQEIDYQIDSGFSGMAMHENRPVLVPNKKGSGGVVICPVQTRSRALGYFYGISASKFVPDVVLKMISIILLNCANTIEAQQLYRKLAEQNRNLEKEVKELRGILPICSYCKKVRDDQGYWEQVEHYLRISAEVVVSHSICPTCLHEHYPDDAEEVLDECGITGSSK